MRCICLPTLSTSHAFRAAQNKAGQRRPLLNARAALAPSRAHRAEIACPSPSPSSTLSRWPHAVGGLRGGHGRQAKGVRFSFQRVGPENTNARPGKHMTNLFTRLTLTTALCTLRSAPCTQSAARHPAAAFLPARLPAMPSCCAAGFTQRRLCG
ncbi:hypothetical protein BS50DRAFT_28638 [Corynespora cassiicola Philippines]|uniref:Uncharacterized protein n=1 Tax=Corynespora cassiicola Philippines TaxID=1448308 RepID=A0A2T2PBQ6_CORCC|nr:hypothetical protein BS50DRAFT_28638 [Corynespora cassiicola Philippines]